MNKTTTNGYIDVKIGDMTKTAHFSMNFIKNLRDMGHTLESIGEMMQDADFFGHYIGMSKVLYAAFKAYDRENGLEVDYNEENCLEWVINLDNSQVTEFHEVMVYAVTLNEKLKPKGKLERDKSPQKKEV